MIPVQVRVTKKLMERLDELINCGAYSNRSEVIRDAIRKHIASFDGSYFRKQRLNNTSKELT